VWLSSLSVRSFSGKKPSEGGDMTPKLGLLAIVLALGAPNDCWAWGDQGHKIICEIAVRLAQPTCAASWAQYRRRLSM
jgi:hypothetical protein